MEQEIVLFETFEVEEIAGQTRAQIPQYIYPFSYYCYSKGPVD